MTNNSQITTGGRYAAPGGPDVACLADVASLDDITLRPLAQGVLPVQGTHVICYLDEIGFVEGVVGPSKPSGFVLKTATNPERRSKLAGRLVWLRRAGDRADQRAAMRVVPLCQGTRLKLPGGLEVDAIIADLSQTGAALATRERPDVGTTVTVGKRFATVVRHTQDGIAVAFRLPFGTLTFNDSVVL